MGVFSHSKPVTWNNVKLTRIDINGKLKKLHIANAMTRRSTYSPRLQREDGWCESSSRE